MAPVFEQFALADQFATSKGSNICALSCDNAPAQVILTTRVKAPFEPGNFDEKARQANARQQLQFRCDSEIEEYFKGLDTWAIYPSGPSSLIFKKHHLFLILRNVWCVNGLHWFWLQTYATCAVFCIGCLKIPQHTTLYALYPHSTVHSVPYHSTHST